jgi:hypothetical protein
MSQLRLFSWLKANQRPGASAKRIRPACKPRLDPLENRLLPSTLTVLNNADSGPGSLRDTIAAAASGDTIVFAHSLSGQTITLTSGQLTLTKNLDIEGLGADKLTVSGDTVSRVFAITAGATDTIAGLTIADGVAATGGGIDNAGNLTITNCTVGHNQAVGGMGGGGILNEANASLTFKGGALEDNQASAAAMSDVFGGGLLNLGSANVTSAKIVGNQALGGASFSFFGGSVGGGIDNFGGATLSVTKSTFRNNQAISAAGPYFGLGGAIENNAGADTLHPSTATIDQCTFTGNVASGGTGATGNGGALDNEGPGATMTVTNSALIGNLAIGGPAGDGVTTLSQALGGGVINILGILTISSSAFLGNKASAGSGGSNLTPSVSEGVASGGALVNALGAATVTNCAFAGNQALGGNSAAGPGGIAQGGAVNNTVAGTLTIGNSTFFANTAHGGAGAGGAGGGLGVGGAIDNYSGTGSASTVTDVIVTATTFAYNQALGGSGGAGANGGLGVGGAIGLGQDVLFGFADSPGLAVDGSTFVGNSALGGAGGSGGNGGDGWGGALGIISGSASAANSSFFINLALGGNGGSGGNGGNGFGGGLFNDTGAILTLAKSTVEYNLAIGGEEGAGGSDGQAIGGGVYNLGTFTFDPFTVIDKNHASTSNDNIFP